MIEQVGSFEFPKAINKMKGVKRTLPKKLGNDAKLFFLRSFRQGGFTDSSFEKWTPRKKRLSRTRTSRTQTESATLIKSGALRRSIQVLRHDFNHIAIGTKGIPYARRHNEGLNGMPARPFIGSSRKLRMQLQQRIERELKDVL